MLLVEKYRPHLLTDIIGQDKIIKYTMDWVEAKEMPHVILVGPSGSGKTTWAEAVASAMFNGFDVWNNKHPDFKMLNASDERGIDAVRGEFKEFSGANKADNDVPFRILFLDEADKITGDAQGAMRNIIETNSHKCRFILSGNRADYIEPMISRGATLRFQAIPDGPMFKALSDICMQEKIPVTIDVLEAIVKHYHGDLRKAINDSLEKVRHWKEPVKLSDLDFDDDMGTVVEKVKDILMQPTTIAGENAKSKYAAAREFFEKEHARLQFNVRDFIEQLHGALGPDALKSAKAFSEVDDRIRAGGSGSKDVHMGYLLAVIAGGGE